MGRIVVTAGIVYQTAAVGGRLVSAQKPHVS